MATSELTSNALLYTLTTDPNPLQVSTNGTITVVGSMPGQGTYDFDFLKIEVVSDSDPKTPSNLSLTSDVGAIVATPPTIKGPSGADWTVSVSGGTFTFYPPNDLGALQANTNLMFTLSNIPVNPLVGTTTVNLVGQVNKNTTPAQYLLGKFPQGFTLTQITPNPNTIDPNGTTTLNWTGSLGNYTLEYNGKSYPITSPPYQGAPNPANYSYQVDNLLETTTFYLTVTADSGAVQVQQECMVTVVRPQILSFQTSNNGTEARTGAPLTLSWQTQNVTSCDLVVNGVTLATNLPANATGYAVTAPRTSGNATFELIGYGSDRTQTVTSQFSILVYQFKLQTNSTQIATVGPMPYQLLVRPDGDRVFVACQYPYQLGSFNVQLANFPTHNSSLYMIDTSKFSSPISISPSPIDIIEGIAMPQSDPGTQCVTRLANNPANNNQVFFASNNAVVVNWDSSTNSMTTFPAAYVPTGLVSMVLGLGGTAQPGIGYPAVQYVDRRYFTNNLPQAQLVYLNSSSWSSFQGDLIAKLNELNMDFSGITLQKAFWSISAVSDWTLIAFSVAAQSSLYLIFIEADFYVRQVNIDNFITGPNFPPAVTWLTNSYGPYCVSGVDATQDTSIIVVMGPPGDGEIRRFQVPDEVRAVVASPDGVHLYASLKNNTVVRIQTEVGTNHIIDTIAGDPSGSNSWITPWALAISPDGTRLYVGDVGNVGNQTDGTQLPNGTIWQVEIADGSASSDVVPKHDKH